VGSQEDAFKDERIIIYTVYGYFQCNNPFQNNTLFVHLDMYTVVSFFFKFVLSESMVS